MVSGPRTVNDLVYQLGERPLDMPPAGVNSLQALYKDIESLMSEILESNTIASLESLKTSNALTGGVPDGSLGHGCLDPDSESVSERYAMRTQPAFLPSDCTRAQSSPESSRTVITVPSSRPAGRRAPSRGAA